MAEQYRIFADAERPLDEAACWKITVEAWAAFMLEDEASEPYWDRMRDEFPDFQFGVYEGDTLVACGNSIPVV